MYARTLLGKTPFSVTARVAMQLGRESISSSIVAVLELVKNAYDADAESVWITFQDIGTDGALLVIEDDGTGMSRGQLENIWMVIGTDSKRTSARSSRKNRVLTGEKGLGRLGLDRLCKLTCVQSFTEDSEVGVEIDIDWTKYEQSSQRLESIEHEVYEIPKDWQDPLSGERRYKLRGTRLVLVGLKDGWDGQGLQRLKAELALLISPFGDVNNFNIFLESGQELPKINGRISASEGLLAAEWKVVSELFCDHDNYYVKHKMVSSVYDAVFEYGPQLWNETIRDTGSNIPRCGQLTFELHFILRDSADLVGFERSQIDTFLEANQGIRIYRDGFRVKPYGEPSGEGDWLSLSLRKTQSPAGVKRRPIGSWRVGYNQIVGAVFISREANSGLLDQTNREGIVEGPPFYDLRRFALHGVTFFERKRQEFELARDNADPYEKARDGAEKISEVSRQAAKELVTAVAQVTEIIESGQVFASDPQSTEQLRNLSTLADTNLRAAVASQQAQAELVRAAEEQQEELQRQKDTLGNLASLGILAAAFGHETLRAANLVYNNAALLNRNIDDLMYVLPDVNERIRRNASNISAGAAQIETFAKFTIGNVSKDKRNRTKLGLEEVTDKVLDYFIGTLKEEKGITIDKDYEVGRTPEILGFRIDWESIIINLLINAVWALEDTPRAKRTIRIRILSSGEHLDYYFADSGRGLESGTESLIFVPTFSTKRNLKGDVFGTGMGLAIVKNLIEAGHGGVINVLSPSEIGGAEFHIQIPVPKLADRGKSRKTTT